TAVGVAFVARGFLHGDASRGERFFVSGVDVRDVDVQPDGKSGISGVGLGDHDHGIADAHLGGPDAAVGGIEAAKIHAVEGAIQEVNHALGVFGHDVD